MNIKTKALLRLIRTPNLIIIGVTLCLLYFNAEEQTLNGLNFLILCLGTMGIAAAGNIINDILDVDIDRINKRDRVVVGSIISVQMVWNFYFFLNIGALSLSVWLRSIDLFLFFLGAIVLLYFYSTSWKREALIGNIVIAFLCAWVVIEFWWFSNTLTTYWDGILTAYTVFAFLSTLMRELIKDVEDIEGDRLQGCQTLVIQKGTSFVKKVILSLLSCLLILLIVEATFFYNYTAYLAGSYLIIALILPLFYLIKILIDAKTTSDFSRISNYLKIYMLLGLFLLLLV